MSPQGYKNMDLESQDPIFNANLGQDENLIWTKKLRCSHSINLKGGLRGHCMIRGQRLGKRPNEIVLTKVSFASALPAAISSVFFEFFTQHPLLLNITKPFLSAHSILKIFRKKTGILSKHNLDQSITYSIPSNFDQSGEIET